MELQTIGIISAWLIQILALIFSYGSLNQKVKDIKEQTDSNTKAIDDNRKTTDITLLRMSGDISEIKGMLKMMIKANGN